MPVRVKQRSVAAERRGGHAREWNRLRQNVVSLILAWPSHVAVTLYENETRQGLVLRDGDNLQEVAQAQTVLDQSYIYRVLSQALMVLPEGKASWVSVAASTTGFTVDGAVSLSPSPSKSVQFISIGIRPLIYEEGSSVLHDEINRLFTDSEFGTHHDHSDTYLHPEAQIRDDITENSTRFEGRELRSGKKGINRHPQFYIRILLSSELSTSPPEQDRSIQDTAFLVRILEILRAMFLAFLTKYHFQPRTRDKRPFMHPGGFNGDRAFDGKVLKGQQVPKTSVVWQRELAQRFSHPKTGMSPATPDLLYQRVQLPNFRQSAPIERYSDDVLSSRIRQGASPKPKMTLLPQTSILVLQRASSAPPSLSDRSSSDHDLRSARVPLIIDDGKLSRVPFAELISNAASSRSASSSNKPKTAQDIPSTSTVISPTTMFNKEVWINPLTKSRSIVDIDTGNVMPEVNAHNGLSTPNIITRQSRHSMARQESTRSSRSEPPPSTWLSDVLGTWKNPVYQSVELEVPRISFGVTEEMTKTLCRDKCHVSPMTDADPIFKDAMINSDRRIHKGALRHARVVSQLDNKYILVMFHRERDGEMLVIIDQHAADERVRVESLLESFFSRDPSESGKIATTTLEDPINFELNATELLLLRKYSQHFARWGILYNTKPSTSVDKPITGEDTPNPLTKQRLEVTSIPIAIHERCKQEPRLLVELIRKELWNVNHGNLDNNSPPQVLEHSRDSWLHNLHACPQGILDLLNSRACRSAIMFNDALTIEQCGILVKRLAECKFPFQCAHGRPSLIPLVEFGSFPTWPMQDTVDEDIGSFGARFAAWRREMKMV